MLQAQVNYWTLQEQKRHNLESEAQGRAGLSIQESSLKENIRHNQAIEGYNYGNLAESIRHNTAMEDYNWSDLGEKTRHNTQTESIQSTANQIQYAGMRESARHNQAVETENEKHNRAVEAEASRSNLAREQETARHNQATEEQTNFKNTVDAGVSQRNASSNERQAAAAESRAEAEWYNAKSRRAQTWVDGVTKVLDTFSGIGSTAAKLLPFVY